MSMENYNIDAAICTSTPAAEDTASVGPNVIDEDQFVRQQHNEDEHASRCSDNPGFQPTTEAVYESTAATTWGNEQQSTRNMKSNMLDPVVDILSRVDTSSQWRDATLPSPFPALFAKQMAELSGLVPPDPLEQLDLQLLALSNLECQLGLASHRLEVEVLRHRIAAAKKSNEELMSRTQDLVDDLKARLIPEVGSSVDNDISEEIDRYLDALGAAYTASLDAASGE